MATLSGTKQKQKKTFITLVIAIILVLAAIAYVLYGELTSKSAFLDNQDFAAALSENLGKAPSFIKEADLAEVDYLGISYSEDTVQVITAGEEFVTSYLEYLDKYEAGEDVSSYDLTSLVKAAVFEADEAPVLDDIKYFTGAKVMEVSGVTVSDSSIFSGMTGLVNASITAGLTEVNGFAGINAETLQKLNLSGNTITDWSALNAIADKVIVNSGYMIEPSEDGTIDINNLKYTETTLAEQIKEDAEKAEENTEATPDTAEEALKATEETQPVADEQ